MPRIYNEDRNALDYCLKCFESVELDALQNEKNDVDADHPPYEDTGYHCEICKKPLTSKDA